MTKQSNLITKQADFFTTTLLLNEAANLIIASTNKRNGDHMDIYDAVRKVRWEGRLWPISARRRAVRILDHLFQGKSFGKRVSDSLNNFAVKSVLKNRDSRVKALQEAAVFARHPIRCKTFKVDTSPTKG